MPEETSGKRVTKWNVGTVGYDIVSDESNARIVSLLKESLQFPSKETGLKFSTASGFDVDLDIAVIPDISALASPAARQSVTNYFQDFYRKSKTQGGFQIDAASWDASFEEAVPRCFGVTLTYQHVVERAFLAVQQGENALCIDIALGEILGLVNIRKYYLQHDQSVSSDLIGVGFHTLYDTKIVAGMSRSDASDELREVCDGQ